MTKFTKNKGFLLAEAIFAIFITMLSVFVLQCLISNLKASQKNQHRTDELAFTYVQLDRFFHEKGTIVYLDDQSSTATKAVICKQVGHKEKKYAIQQYQDMLRMTTNRSGHMPLLLGVRQTYFDVEGNILKIEIEEKGGRKSELYFKLHEKPKQKDEKKNQKSSGKRSVKQRVNS